MCWSWSHERWGRRGAWAPSAQMEISRPFLKLEWQTWSQGMGGPQSPPPSYEWMKSQEYLVHPL